jgi:apolipoprotein N-acyltransferase
MGPIGRIVLGCAVAGLSAVLLTISFAPHDAWFLIWVGFVPMAVAQHRILPSRLSGLAPAIGVGGFTAGCFGGVFPGSAAWYMKALPFLVAGAVFVVTRGERARLTRSGYVRWPLQAALIWVAIELLRSFVPALGTWGFLGYAMYRQIGLIQPVSMFGMFGLDWLIVVTNYALALLVIAMLDRRKLDQECHAIPLGLAARWCAGVLVAIVAWSAASLAMLPSREGATVRIAALQPGRRPWQLGASSSEARDRGMIAILSEQTRRAAAQGARMIVWPESALGADPQVAYRDELPSLAREVGAYLFIGYLVHTPAGNRNEVVTLGPDGAFLGTYGKNHPVSFMGGTSVSRGTYRTYDTPFGTVGAVICADIDFTDTPREMARRGAKVLAVPSADWPAIATMHYVLGVFRALETRAAIAKSEYSRDSVIIDGSGAILASSVTPQEREAVLVADVALHAGTPLAARWGDWFGWLCVAGVIVEALATRTASRWGIATVE